MTQDTDLAAHAASFGLQTVKKESFQEPLMILSAGMTPSKSEMAFFPDLLILHAHSLSPSDAELISTLKNSNLFTIQLVMGPVPICKDALLPSEW